MTKKMPKTATGITPKMILDAYNNLSDQTSKYMLASMDLITAKHNLETARLENMVNGLIIGKNADEREASARAIMPTLFDKQEAAEKFERLQKFELTLKEIQVSKVNALLRLEEIVSHELDPILVQTEAPDGKPDQA